MRRPTASLIGAAILSCLLTGSFGSGFTGIDTLARAQEFTLDQLGNFAAFKIDADGDGYDDDGDLTQARVHNKANEIDTNDSHSDAPGASITATHGANWRDPAAHAAGNMTLAPRLDAKAVRPIAQWLDLNGQYYGDYSFQRRERRKPSQGGVAGLRDYLRANCDSCHRGGADRGRPLADQPPAALVNIAAPDRCRALLGPLAESAGGWGQCGRPIAACDSPEFKALFEKVQAATGPAEPPQAKPTTCPER